jgi:hypothetical protein
MQLTKDDVKIGIDCTNPFIYYSKFQQVVEFYEKYANSEGYIKTVKGIKGMKDENAPWNRLYKDFPEIARKFMKSKDMDYDTWLFSYCFKDGYEIVDIR